MWQVGRQHRLKLWGCAVPFLTVTRACTPPSGTGAQCSELHRNSDQSPVFSAPNKERAPVVEQERRLGTGRAPEPWHWRQDR